MFVYWQYGNNWQYGPEFLRSGVVGGQSEAVLCEVIENRFGKVAIFRHA